MPIDLVPAPPAVGSPTTDPEQVVSDFLALLAESELDAAMDLLAEDVLYVNVGLPAIRGRRTVARAFRLLEKPSVGFEVFVHASSADGAVVLTERTDVIRLGGFRSQFWVWGRFEVTDGRITLWRDAFDTVDILRAMVRGLIGVVLPAARPKPPTSTTTPPGRHQP